MLSNFTIDTGEPRHIQGHFISGAIAAGIVVGTRNYTQYKKDEISSKELLSNTVRLSLQGGIATASAISTANCIGRGNWLGAGISLGAGALGVYATEKFYDKVDTKYIKKEVQ